MWKFRFYHQWQYEETEAYLSDMEAQGYRLEKVICSFFMKFKKAKPKSSQYYFHYHFIKDQQHTHFEILNRIKGMLNGHRVCGMRLFEADVFRICNENADLNEIRAFRDHYLVRAFKQKIGISTFFFIVSILPLLAERGMEREFQKLFLAMVAVVALFAFSYCCVGLRKLRKK